MIVTLHHNELWSDIRRIAWAAAHSLPAEDECRRHLLRDIDEEGNKDIAQRNILLAHALLCDLVHGSDPDGRSEEDVLGKRESYRIEVDAADVQSTMTALTHLCHRFVVYRTLCDWLGVVYPALQPAWEQAVEGAATEIRHFLTAMPCATTRPLFPLYP